MNSLTMEIASLPISERLQLVEDLWDSIAQDTPLQLSTSQKAELDRRFAEHQQSPGSSITWDAVRNGLFNHAP